MTSGSRTGAAGGRLIAGFAVGLCMQGFRPVIEARGGTADAFVAEGLAEVESYLPKHADFQSFLEDRD